MLAVVVSPHRFTTTLTSEASIVPGASYRRITPTACPGRVLGAEPQVRCRCLRLPQLVRQLRVAPPAPNRAGIFQCTRLSSFTYVLFVSGFVENSHARMHQHLSAPSSAFPSSPFLNDVRQVSPGRPSPCLRHYTQAFGYYAASALLTASWHFRFHYWLGGPGVPKFLHPL